MTEPCLASAQPGCHLLENGALEIDLGPLHGVRLRLRPWAAGGGVERWEDGRWLPEPLDPGIPLLPCEAVPAPLTPAAVAGFLAPVPAEVKAAAARYRTFQTTQLRLAAGHGRAFIELQQGSPNLAWIIAGAQQHDWRDPATLAGLLKRRRRDILRALIGSGSPATLRLLERIDLIDGNAAEFQLVWHALQQPDWPARLRHWPRVPIEVLHLLRRRPDMLESRMLELAQQPPTPRQLTGASLALRGALDYWRDTLRVGETLGIEHAPRLRSECRTPEQLRLLHDRWTERLNRRNRLQLEAGIDSSPPFPPPPVAGTAAIVPITDLRSLRVEGDAMHHCVASYEGAIRAGRCYIYRVLEPERATLSLVPRAGQWTVGELKCVCNRSPAGETRAAVEHWLQLARGGAAASGEQRLR